MGWSNCKRHGLLVHYLQCNSRRLLMHLAVAHWHGTIFSSHGCGANCVCSSVLSCEATSSSQECVHLETYAMALGTDAPSIQ